MSRSNATRLDELPHPLHHVTVTRRFSDMPKHFTARVLLLRQPDGCVETCIPFAEYLRAHRSYSDTWQCDHARALGLFWDYCVVHSELKWTPRQLFREFAVVLLEGTLDRDRETVARDLLWPPVPLMRARRLIGCLEQFAKWHSTQHNAGPDLISESTKIDPSSSHGLMNLLVWGRLRRLSMLQHLKRSPRTTYRSTTRVGRPLMAGKQTEHVKYFPADYAERLLWVGYLRNNHTTDSNIFLRYNIRDMMMALLDGWGGLRRSEGLHLWINDVQEEPTDPGHALVVLNHPGEGPAEYEDPLSGATIKTRRKNALQRLYGMRPRNEVLRGHYHVGWKGMALNADHQSCIYWIDQQAAALFLVLYRGYMRFVRPAVMAKRRAMGGADHPFLFVSHAINDKTGLPGEPYSEKSYERNHRAAVLRIGLKHEKALGTTSQGLRHRYGQNLADLNVPPSVIREGLHHVSMFSQLVYTKPSPGKVNAILQGAQRNLVEGHRAIAPLTQTTTDELLRLREFVEFGGSFD